MSAKKKAPEPVPMGTNAATIQRMAAVHALGQKYGAAGSNQNPKAEFMENILKPGAPEATATEWMLLKDARIFIGSCNLSFQQGQIVKDKHILRHLQQAKIPMKALS